MLVLTRKKEQSIVIDGKTEIIVLDVSGETVKLGIKAPREVSVHRKELYEAIRNENIRAAGTGSSLPPEAAKRLLDNYALEEEEKG